MNLSLLQRGVLGVHRQPAVHAPDRAEWMERSWAHRPYPRSPNEATLGKRAPSKLSWTSLPMTMTRWPFFNDCAAFSATERHAVQRA